MKVLSSNIRRALVLAVFVLAIIPVVFLSIRGQSAEDLFKKGNAKQFKFDFDGAIKDYDEAIRLHPNHSGCTLIAVERKSL